VVPQQRPEIIVIVEDGCVKSVLSNYYEGEVVVIDCDLQGSGESDPEESIYHIPQSSGDVVLAAVSERAIQHNPRRVAELLTAIRAQKAGRS